MNGYIGKEVIRPYIPSSHATVLKRKAKILCCTPSQQLYYARVHLRLLKVFVTRKPNVIWRWRFHQLTFLAKSQNQLNCSR